MEESILSQVSGNNDDKKSYKSKKSKKKSKGSISEKSKNSSTSSLINFKSQSNQISLSKIKSDKQDTSLFKCPNRSTNIVFSNNNNDLELHQKFSIFLKGKKFKISNEFNAKNSKKFLEKKNKCLEKIVLSDIIENENEKNTEISSPTFKRKKSRRNSGQIAKTYCIIVSNYDDKTQDEKKYNYSVKHTPRKIKDLKKNKNLSKYFLNSEAKNQSQTLDFGFMSPKKKKI